MKLFVSFSFVFIYTTVAHAQNKGKFQPHGHIYGEFTSDYYYKFSGESNNFSNIRYAKTKRNFNAFNIRKATLGYFYMFKPDISGELELEGTDLLLSEDHRPILLKQAWMKISNIIPRGNLIVGKSDTPTFATFSEDIWEYDYLADTMPEMRGFGSDVDLGVKLEGNFNQEGTFGYVIMVANGRGEINKDKYKKIYLEFHTMLENGLLFELYADYEGNSTNGINTGRTTFKGFAGYQLSKFTVGLSGIVQIRKNAVQNHSVNSIPYGISIFAHGNLIKNKLNVIARYDFFNPDKASPYNGHFILFSLDYMVTPSVHFMPNLWINAYGGKDGASSPPAGMIARLTFYYEFP